MRDLVRQSNFLIGAALLALVAIAVLLGPTLAPYDPQAFHPQARLQPPSAAFPLGTDQFGRDLLSRLLWGARPTVLFGVGATLLGILAGGLIGLLAGVSAGAVDAVIMRVLDGLIAVPDLLFALVIVTVLGNGTGNALLAVAIAFTPGLARITRSTVLSIRSRDYVLAAMARGEGRAWVMLCEVLPNAVGPVIVEATIRVAFAVMIGATLGFLGLGAQPPSTEWGLMIATARQFMARNIWTVLVPSVAIAVVALGFNLVGDALRDRLDPPRPAVTKAALEVTGYHLAYQTRDALRPALSGIDLTIATGETLGLVGASGSGKTSLAWSILRMLPANAREGGGTLALAGQDLRAMTRRQLAHLRGRSIGMVFQDPSTALNPSMTLGRQVAEVLVRHHGLAPRAAAAEVERWLARTGLPDPRSIMRRYPHQVSGGEKQRVVIATAFACRPQLIILDEPTTALDSITGARILDLFAELRTEVPVACLYISHDLALVARVADRVAVLHAGEIVETGPASDVLRVPRAPQTRRLVDAIADPAHRLAPPPPSGSLLALDGVSVDYGRRTWLGRLLRTARPALGAADVSLTVRQGEVLGVVGESGSGKSTLARAICGLAPFTGAIGLDGTTLTGQDRMPATWRRDVQIVFQNPDASLNPRHRVGTILGRPLRLYGGGRSRDIGAGVAAMLEEVGLPPAYASRHPHELSGGEKQRVAIARAFAAAPKLVVCDEVTSALDVVVQKEIVALLLDLQARHGTAFFFITHDLNLVRQVAHRIAVMFRGRLVDLFDAADAATADRHPYTQALLAARI